MVQSHHMEDFRRNAGWQCLRCRAASAAQLTLSWIDNSSGTTTFNVERKTGADSTYARIATTGAGATSYSDPAVVLGTTYC